MQLTAHCVSAVTLRFARAKSLGVLHKRLRYIHIESRGLGRHNRVPLTHLPVECPKSTVSVLATIMAKRKRLSTLASEKPLTTVPIPVPGLSPTLPSPTKRPRANKRTASQTDPGPISTNPDENNNVLDGTQALRASPDSDGSAGILNLVRSGTVATKQVKRDSEDVPSLVNDEDSDSPLSDLSDMDLSPKKPAGTSGPAGSTSIDKAPSTAKAPRKQSKVEMKSEPQFLDPEADAEEEADEEDIQAALSRPPPVNSEYLPLPWKGRLGYVRSRRYGLAIIAVLILSRHVCVLICGSPTPLFSAQELVGLHRSWKIDTLSKIQVNPHMPQRTDPTEINQLILLVVRPMSKALDLQTRGM